MWWSSVLVLAWWCGASAIPSPGPIAATTAVASSSAPSPQFDNLAEWKCPEITNQQPTVECSCDMPHTLRCTGDITALDTIAHNLRALQPSASVSLLDCTIQNLSKISDPVMEGVALHGLVISSGGDLSDVGEDAFRGLAAPLQALGLPNNKLSDVPIKALQVVPELDKLDLSGNKIKAITGSCFMGLKNLSFIDISDNLLSRIAPDTFKDLPLLKTLRLRGNRLTLPVITKLNPISTLEDLDLSDNAMIGPLGPKTLPVMEDLRDLQLSHNSLSSIKMGALQTVALLTSLKLQHNQIDVIEDHAFSHLTLLESLDLAHNRIVAVSGASLAHLSNLTELDLRHNFLRALTPDLIQPLRSLKQLKLEENEISIVASDALRPTNVLVHFTLSDNPLNCDCSLSDFAIWLRNSSLSAEDKATAICMTPPSLENGLLIEVPLENLLCGEEEHDAQMSPLSAPFKARINLVEFKYDGSVIKLQWDVEDETSPYSCDAIFVYEEEGPNEVLVESNPLKCNSSEMRNPKVLNVTVPETIQLQQRHRYRYCIVLLESGQADDVSLILGCSDVIPLIQNVKIQPMSSKDFAISLPKVISIQANLSSYGTLSMDVKVYPLKNCELNVAILEQSALLSQRRINCSIPRYSFVGLEGGPYRVCANIVNEELNKPRCVTVFKKEARGFTGLDVAFVSIFLVLCFMVIGLVWGVRKVLLKPKIETHQCFMPTEYHDDDDNQVQHSRYVKLQATTKL